PIEVADHPLGERQLRRIVGREVAVGAVELLGLDLARSAEPLHGLAIVLEEERVSRDLAIAGDVSDARRARREGTDAHDVEEPIDERLADWRFLVRQPPEPR